MQRPDASASESAVALADLGELHGRAQRTALVRIVLALALVGTLALLFDVARSAGAGRAAVFPEGTSTGVVALDMSASISGPDVRARRDDPARHRQREPVDRPRHVLRHRVRAAAAELAAGRAAAVHPVLHAAPLLRRHAGLRADAVGHVLGRDAESRPGLEMARKALAPREGEARRDPARQRPRRRGLRPGPARRRGAAAARRRTSPFGSCRSSRPRSTSASSRRSSARTRSSTRASSRTRRNGMRQSVAAPAPWALLLLGGAARRPARGNERWNGRLEVEGRRRHERAQSRKHRAALLALLCRRPRGRSSRCFAADVSAWRSTVARDDLRFRALPTHRDLWRPATTLPGDPASLLIGTGSTISYRSALQYFWFSRIGSNPEVRQDTPTLRATAQNKLLEPDLVGADRAAALGRREPPRRPRRDDAVDRQRLPAERRRSSPARRSTSSRRSRSTPATRTRRRTSSSSCGSSARARAGSGTTRAAATASAAGAASRPTGGGY